MSGLPSAWPSVVSLLRRRRRPAWRDADVIRVVARDVWLDPGGVDSFLAVCGGPDPPCLPLTFPYALVTPMHLAVVADPRFPLAPVGLVHKAERIRRWRAVAVGTRVDVVCEARDFREGPGGVSFDLTTTLTQAGERIWDSRTTAIRRSGGAPTPYAGDAVREGEEVRWDVPVGMGRRYAWVSGNFDPIHVSRWTSWPFGFRGAVAHGMWTAARCVATVGDPYGAATLDVRFRSPLTLPARVRFVGAPGVEGTRFAVWPDVHGAARPHLEGTLTPHVAPDEAADVS